MQFVVTGANRGIGLEYVRQLTERGDDVVATARRPAKADELQEVADEADAEVHVEQLDVTEQSSVESFADHFPVDSLDVLINNAGVLHRGGGPEKGFNWEEIYKDFEVNAVGSLRVTQVLLPYVKADGGGTIVNMTSKMGSIADNGSGGSYAYRMAKCSLNMATKSLAVDLEDEDVLVFCMHPGWVQTRMGGDDALITPQKSVRNMLERIDEAGPEQAGAFVEWDGGTVPW